MVKVKFKPENENELGGTGDVMGVYCDDSGDKPVVVFKLKHVVLSDGSQGPEEGNMIHVYADQIIWNDPVDWQEKQIEVFQTLLDERIKKTKSRNNNH